MRDIRFGNDFEIKLKYCWDTVHTGCQVVLFLLCGSFVFGCEAVLLMRIRHYFLNVTFATVA